MNRNVVTTISYNEYKDELLNNICLRHFMNRTQSKDYRIGTFMSCFDDKIYVQ